MTQQEWNLWYFYLRNHRLKWYRQRIIDRFIVDFYCHAAKLVIEIDGGQHYTEQGIAYDTERTPSASTLKSRNLLGASWVST